MRRAGILVLASTGLLFFGVTAFSFYSRRPVPKPGSKAVSPLPPPASDPAPNPPPPVDIRHPEPEAGIRVEVVTADGRPIEGAQVFDVRKTPLLATTDGRGVAILPFESLTPTGPGQLGTLRVDHESYAPVISKVRQEYVRIVMGPGANLQIHVAGEADQPLAGADVKAFAMEREHWARKHKTDAEGSVRVTGVPGGGLMIRVEASGFEEGRKFVIVPANETRIVRFNLTRAKKVHVRVRTSSGEPVAEAEVYLIAEHALGNRQAIADGYRTNSWQRKTDRSGVALFDSVPTAAIRGQVSAKAQSHPRSKWQTVDVAEPAREIEIILDPGASLSIDVVDPGGTSVACRVSVSGGSLQGGAPEGAQEKAAGAKARFAGVPVGVPLTIVLSRHQGTVHVESGVMLTPSEARDLLLTLPLQCAVRIQARDTDGAPVPGYLQLGRQQGGPGAPPVGVRYPNLAYSVQVPREGQVQISMFAGNYKLYFTPRDGTKVEKDVRIESDMTVEVEVETGKTVTGIVQDSSGAPLAGVQIHWSSPKANCGAETDQQGRFELIRVPSQPGKVNAATSGINVLLYEGLPFQDLRLTLPISTIRGRVARSTGEPASVLIWGSAVGTPTFQATESIPLYSGVDGTFEARVPSGRWQFWMYSENGILQEKPVEVDASAPGVVEVALQLAPASPPK